MSLPYEEEGINCSCHTRANSNSRAYVTVNHSSTTRATTEPCCDKEPCERQAISAEDTFVMIVNEGLFELESALNRLERLWYNVAPNMSTIKDGNDNPTKTPQITFDYIWGILPEAINSASARVDAFYYFIKDIIYKVTDGDPCCVNAKETDHLLKVNRACSEFNESIAKLESLPDILSGSGSPCDSVKETKSNTFADTWRSMPTILNGGSQRIRKVELILTDMLTKIENESQKENNQQKHR